MQRIKCEIREADQNDRGMLVLLAEETLHPLAEGAGHPERYHTGDVVGLLERADVFVAEAGKEPAGFVALETDEDALAVRCICVNPGFEARGVANQLLDWAEGLAIGRRLTRLIAFVPSADEPSLRLYRGHGFTGEGAGAETMALEKRLPALPG
jgi:ribosomal protein S18 acetylase RimI-like enzyme